MGSSPRGGLSGGLGLGDLGLPGGGRLPGGNRRLGGGRLRGGGRLGGGLRRLRVLRGEGEGQILAQQGVQLSGPGLDLGPGQPLEGPGGAIGLGLAAQAASGENENAHNQNGDPGHGGQDGPELGPGGGVLPGGLIFYGIGVGTACGLALFACFKLSFAQRCSPFRCVLALILYPSFLKLQ